MHFDRKNLSNEQLNIFTAAFMAKNDRRKNAGVAAAGKDLKMVQRDRPGSHCIGVALALEEDEWIMPLHRNLGVFTSRNMPLHKLFMQWQGSKEGYSKGRERSFHFGNKRTSYLWHDLASRPAVSHCRWSGTCT